MQYTPVLNTGLNWQIYNGPGFAGAVEIPKTTWFHLRLEVVGAQAKLYVKDMDNPALVMNDLKSGVQKGQVALAVLTGATYFTNFEIRTTPDAPWQRHLPPMPAGTLTKWSLSPSYDALARNLERPLAPSESNTIQWQDVEAEPPGLVVIYRYRQAPHPVVSFATDFSKRLDPQPGMKVIYARTNIDSDREQVKKLYIGYSDDVSVFVNGKDNSPFLFLLLVLFFAAAISGNPSNLAPFALVPLFVTGTPLLITLGFSIWAGTRPPLPAENAPP